MSKKTRFYSAYTLALIFVCGVFLLSACEREYSPKPHAYPRLHFPPQHAYQPYTNADCPFVFEYPQYAQIQKEERFFEEKTENPCWFNIYFPDFNASIHFSYKSINGNNTLAKLLEDAHKLTSKHTIKAEYIDDYIISTPHQVHGLMSDVGGNAASAVQFFLTDSTQHFIRGALYFNAPPNYDSVAPVITYLKEDMKQLFQSFQWK
ncbi:MAG: gliding motility lipoprotein GldD [Sphingobacteriales bacterium]|nr:gliding motility lipoprotein GldD [Sphingobacteriales bacterium]